MLSLFALGDADSVLSRADLEAAAAKAFARFDCDETIPVACRSHASDAQFFGVAELWHGPTLAFKDLGLQMIGQLLDIVLSRRKKHINIIVGTSGDTGSAAIEGVRGSPHVSATARMRRSVRGRVRRRCPCGMLTMPAPRSVHAFVHRHLRPSLPCATRYQCDIFVLYPACGRISDVQELQMTTVDDDNVHVFGVDGTSDDLDVPIKRLFANEGMVREHNLCSTNSVNVCRIIVQAAHFFYTAFRAREAAPDAPVSIVIPTGAAGNVTSGVLALHMGLDLSGTVHGVASTGSFCVATNENDIVHTLLSTGTASLGRAVAQTMAPAMDIQFAYNVERLLWFASGHDCGTVKRLMDLFESTGSLSLPADIHAAMDKKLHIRSTSVSDADVAATVRRLYDSRGYLVCPHTAVGVCASSRIVPAGSSAVCLATSHPHKFREAVAKSLGSEGPARELVIALRAASTPAVERVARQARLPRQAKFWERGSHATEWQGVWLDKLSASILNAEVARAAAAGSTPAGTARGRAAREPAAGAETEHPASRGYLLLAAVAAVGAAIGVAYALARR